METILFEVPAVVYGLLFGVFFVSVMAVLVFFAKFELSYSKYVRWRETILQTVSVLWLTAFAIWAATFCGNFTGYIGAGSVLAVMAVLLSVFFRWFKKRRLRETNNIVVFVSDLNLILFFIQVLVITLAENIVSAVMIVGCELLFLAVALALLRSLKLRMLSKNGVYWFYSEHADKDGTVHGTLIINEHSRLSAKMKKKAIENCCWARVGEDLQVKISSFHPLRLQEVKKQA